MKTASTKISGLAWLAGAALLICAAGRIPKSGGVLLVVHGFDADKIYARVELTNGTRRTIGYLGTRLVPDYSWMERASDGRWVEENRVPLASNPPIHRKLPPASRTVFWVRIRDQSRPSKIGLVYWLDNGGEDPWRGAPKWLTRSLPWLNNQRARHSVEAPIVTSPDKNSVWRPGENDFAHRPAGKCLQVGENPTPPSLTTAASPAYLPLKVRWGEKWKTRLF